MIRANATNVAWFAAYIAMIGLIVFALNQYRNTALASYGTPEAGEKWEDWRVAAAELGKEGPVVRRAPKSTEPPPLVLMRDHFAACLGISLLLSSCLFGWMMICVRGVMRPVELNYEADERIDA